MNKRGNYGIKLPDIVADTLVKLAQEDYRLRKKESMLHIVTFDINKHDVVDDTQSIKEISIVEKLTEDLSKLEKDILLMRYGFINNRLHSLSEVGLIKGLTRERIRQIEVKAIEKIRQNKKLSKVLSLTKYTN